MRIIGPWPAFLFACLLLIPLGFASGFYLFFDSALVQKTTAAHALLAGGFLVVFIFFVFLVYRILMASFPIPEGDLAEGSRGEFIWMISTLFWLFFFNQLIINHIVPAPLTGLLYRSLGCRVGKNTYFSGIVLDPHFASFGERVTVGLDSLFIPHVIEGKRLAHQRIQIGDRATIGARSTILAGTKIGAGSIVGAMSLVPKGTIIGENELWAGVPAKFIRKLSPS